MSQRSSVLSTIGWAAYLACSWTWCIGMYLPVLLLRDYGVWGFVVFAVPNVIGAAAFGWVLARPDASRRLVEKHRPSLLAFSFITIAFQLYFLVWIFTLFSRDNIQLLVVVAIAGLCVSLFPRSRSGDRGTIIRASIILALSLIAAATFLNSGSHVIRLPPPQHEMDVVWVMPVCLFGFALCPYLDLTFHHARQRSPGMSGAAAFTLGFGVFFLAMILFTFAYAGWLDHAMRSPIALTLTIPAVAVLVHVCVQLIYTMQVHVEQAMESVRPRTRRVAWGFFAFVTVDVIVMAMLVTAPTGHDMSLAEITYRVFLSFYGLVFPAYVWLLMIPTRDGHSGTAGDNGRRKFFIFCFAVGIAAPMFWMGFIEGVEPWLGIGVLVVLASRLALPREKEHTTVTGRKPVGSVSSDH